MVTQVFTYISKTTTPLKNRSLLPVWGLTGSLEAVGAGCWASPCQSTCPLQPREAAGAAEVGWTPKSCGLTRWLQWLEFF